MLRQCIQGARRRRPLRQPWSSTLSALPSSSSFSDNDERQGEKERPVSRSFSTMSGVGVAPYFHSPIITSITQQQQQQQQRNHQNQYRAFGISRHPDPLIPEENRSLNAVPMDDDTADDDDDAIDDIGLESSSSSKGKIGSKLVNRFVTADDLEFADMADRMKEFDDNAAAAADDDDVDAGYGNYGAGNRGGGDDDNDDYQDIFNDTSLFGNYTHSSSNSQGEEGIPPHQADWLRHKAINDELDKRTGRLWSENWVITDEEWMSTETLEDMEDWTPGLATRKSLESVKVFEGGVPTLGQLSTLHLPTQPPPHPGHGSPTIYAKHRRNRIQTRILTAIQLAIHDDLLKILQMTSWEEKQDAVDALFEDIEEKVREKEPILAKLPEFGGMVEKGLEQVLRMAQSRMRNATTASTTTSAAEGEEAKEEGKTNNLEDVVDVMNLKKEPAVPIFMDLIAASKQQSQPPQQSSSPSSEGGDGEEAQQSRPTAKLSTFFTKSNKDGVPNLVYPLNVHHADGVGRMVEEWQLAANKETKRIMMREAMKEIASKVVEAAKCCGGSVKEEEKGAARVFVVGKRGVGKTATLAGIVASARISGHIVVYLPDGDRLRRHGFYVEPSTHRKRLYDLPEIAKEFCEQLLTAHGSDISSMSASKEVMQKFFTNGQMERLVNKVNDITEGESSATDDGIALDKLLEVGIGSTSLSSGCYSTVIDVLMNQTEKPFSVVMDEFNCYYDYGHYTHMDFDPNVYTYIPLNKITILKPFIEAMGLYPSVAGTKITDESSGETMMKWGSIVVATSESRAVKSTFTNSLTESAHALAKDEKHPVHVVDVRRFSMEEVQHVLYNYEVTGVGRLRFDRGDTALNPDEVAYLRMVSGGVGQPLMDACVLPLS